LRESRTAVGNSSSALQGASDFWIFCSRMILQFVMNAGVAALLKMVAGRSRNLQNSGAGSSAAVVAAEVESKSVFSVLRPSFDARSVPGRSLGCLLSAPICRARFHQVWRPESANYRESARKGKFPPRVQFEHGKRCTRVPRQFRLRN